MIGKRTLASLSLMLFVTAGQARAQDRKLLDSTPLSDTLGAIVANLQDRHHAQVANDELRRDTNYLIRLVPRGAAVTPENRVREDAVLGTKPFVFLATPEGLYGKSLLEISLDIGYEAEDILRSQRGKKMVAVVFRYPDDITLSDVEDGRLPAHWRRRLYVPTWENASALFHHLARGATIEPNRGDEFAPRRLFFRSRAEKRFVLGFPAAGLQRIETTDYATLRAFGGADWEYRSLLERKLSLFEHFRGNGRTINETAGSQGAGANEGLLEFLGPNLRLKDLPELAIIDYGALTIEDAADKN
jgi:hypothetical protein